ncbi:DUF4811 domain-containing protein [Loigolactobacillus backii]|uniref:Uncharacterized protein n=1 Tax=Loigolactobacillus backii TaxID=375175 RepID=A0A192H021_9LACO|nr:DUF4811 domain-containing protein [Loigolactobacillus backii]ANK60425.1 hypothetical protein AYR52_09265 [Loigolactobacillus backii]ANK62134.1 hypothetical protein AYR53_04720 [Loigolactobacillus backii]ANK65304.1 hypothetical protein AYR54_08670 [Loigolactobacillus backii]ANK67865.1 hypothetical protein AYR55_09280 [Loigolactobacillus backii]ANK70851.1 hypothetical protein AYR56_12265 [Loigolactobacillus backii]
MILISLFIGVICFVTGVLLLKTRAQQWLVGGLGLILLVLSASLMIGNDNAHWGMHQVSQQQTTKIASISPTKQLPLLIYQPIRQSKTEKVYLYRLANQKKALHTQASIKTTNEISYQATKRAKLVVTTKYWRYQNSFWRWCFSGTGAHHELISRQNKFVLPNNWTTISCKQAAWLEKAAKAKQAAAKTQSRQQIALLVEQAKAKQPALTTQQLQQIKATAEKQVEAKVQQQEQQVAQTLLKQAKKTASQ